MISYLENQRSNPKEFRLLVKLKLLQATTGQQQQPTTEFPFCLLSQSRQRYGDQESEEEKDQDEGDEGCHGGGGDSG